MAGINQRLQKIYIGENRGLNSVWEMKMSLKALVKLYMAKDSPAMSSMSRYSSLYTNHLL